MDAPTKLPEAPGTPLRALIDRSFRYMAKRDDGIGYEGAEGLIREAFRLGLAARPAPGALRDALTHMAAQHRCGCGHPACNRCEDDRMCEAALSIALDAAPAAEGSEEPERCACHRDADQEVTPSSRAACPVHAPPCSACKGRGFWVRMTCSLCGDSTYDHYCNDGEHVPCGPCHGTGRSPGPAPRGAP